jgi:predicted O-linked N-acetylglucosamine transferase (SPINDLY family)
MRQVEGSRLLLRASGSFAERLRVDFERHGISAHRIECVGRVSPDAYWRLFAGVDLALDPFPYNGYSSTCDALWMGVPVVALSGKTTVSRGGVSLLTNVGMTGWIAQDVEQYVQIAAEQARDLDRLAETHRTLRQRMEKSPLRDEPGFARDFEAAIRAMWVEWCARRPRG